MLFVLPIGKRALQINTTLRSFHGNNYVCTIKLQLFSQRSLSRLVRRNFRRVAVPIDAMVGRRVELSILSAVAGWSRSWTSSSSMTRRFIISTTKVRGDELAPRRRLLPLIRNAIVHTFPPRGAEACAGRPCQSIRYISASFLSVGD